MPEHDRRSDLEEARFEEPPVALASAGELVLRPSFRDSAARLLEGAAIGVAFCAAMWAMPASLGASRGVLGVIALGIAVAWWALLRARDGLSSVVRWDASGITELASGAVRTTIAWASARAIVTRSDEQMLVQVIDDDGRAITCAAPNDLGAALRSAGPRTRAAELRPLLEAVAHLPRAAGDGVERRVADAPLSVNGSLLLAVLTVVLADLQRAGDGPPMLAIGGATSVLALGAVPAVFDLAAWWRARRDGARGARRDGPYRDRASARPSPSSVLRRRVLSAAARCVLMTLGIVVLALSLGVEPEPPVPAARFQPSAAMREPPPPPPQARPIAPRPIEEPALGVQPSQRSGAHYVRGASCEPGLGCTRVPVAVDPVSGRRIECVDAEAMQRCITLVGRRPLREEQ